MKVEYVFLLVSFLLIGCSKDEESMANDSSIKLSSYSIRFLAGDECLIDVYSNTDNLSLIDENPEIATGWWVNSGKSIRVKGEGVGVTSICIKDRYNPEILSKIEIISDYFEGIFKEDGDKASIVVQSNDKVIQEKIETELKTMAVARTGTLYSFSKSSKIVIIKDLQENCCSGSYDWNIDSITIKMNEMIQKYLFRRIDDSLVEIDLDLTEIYKLKYPNSFIYRVRVSLGLSNVKCGENYLLLP